MTGILVFFIFIFSGIIQAKCLFREKSHLVKLWLGSVMGLMEMMWLPSLFAYLFDFGMRAQLYALSASLLLSGAACLLYLLFGGKKPCAREKDRHAGWILALVLPASLIAAYIHYTHSFVNVDGALHVGQSTYGDLCMHAGFITGLIGQSYPPEYTILPGTQLGYPFLVDAMSSTMVIFGTDLAVSIYLPGAYMTFLVYLGFALFSAELTGNRRAMAVAFALFFFSGGLGFFKTIFQNGRIDADALGDALFSYYMTPTNMPDENLRWVNALSDLLVPQRTLLAGWMCLLPALYLLVRGMREKKYREFVILAVWAGAMPMIHTHSFLALGAVSLGALLYMAAVSKDKRRVVSMFAVYGLGACAVAAYQLLEWTFPQTLEGGSLRLYFNWVNNTGVSGTGQNGAVAFFNETGKLLTGTATGLIDRYFDFWFVNVGVVLVIFPLAAMFTKNRAVKALSVGALLLFALSETVLFQPNVYDNIKLFYVCYLIMLPAAANLLVRLLKKLSGKNKDTVASKLRRAASAVLLQAFLFVSCISGAVTIAREAISDYRIFSEAHVNAAEYIRGSTPKDSVFLTANNHTNAPSVLAGRRIVCGPGLYLYYHGLDYSQREEDVRRMLAEPAQNTELFVLYGVDYIYISSHERSMGADEEFFEKHCNLLFEDTEDFENVKIYACFASEKPKINNINGNINKE